LAAANSARPVAMSGSVALFGVTGARMPNAMKAANASRSASRPLAVAASASRVASAHPKAR
jgi:hypothetical protein